MDVTKLDIRENKFTDHARHANPLRKEVPAMPREKFKTLTEQMFYILLCLCEECSCTVRKQATENKR